MFTESQKRQLRKLGHKLKPVVIIGGNGLTEAVLNEINSTLDIHELIKVRVNSADRVERDEMIKTFCAQNHAELIQRVGNIALIFRRNPQKPKIHV